MKKYSFLAIAMLLSAGVQAATDHYLLRDGNHVQHLKINQIADDVTVTVDVDFEPNADEQGKQACSADISGDAKYVAENEILMRKHWDGEARYCNLNIKLTQDGATVEQSEGCGYFVAGICRFSTEGRTLVRVP